MGFLDSYSNRAVSPRLTAISLSRTRKDAVNSRNAQCVDLARQLSAAHLEPVEPAQQGHGDLVRVEKRIGHIHHLLAGNGFDLIHNFLDAEKVLKTHFLPSQVRHP